jgi:hypothetical protein
MRRLLISITAVAAVMACAKTETPPADTTAAMAPAPAPVAVVALTDADVSGTWQGTSMPLGSDSVVAHWKQVCAAGKCTGTTTENPKTTTPSTYTVSGDSAVGVSEPFSVPAMKGGKIIDTWTVHFSGDNATGTGAQKMASKPDSVVMAYRFTGSRTAK